MGKPRPIFVLFFVLNSLQFKFKLKTRSVVVGFEPGPQDGRRRRIAHKHFKHVWLLVQSGFSTPSTKELYRHICTCTQTHIKVHTYCHLLGQILTCWHSSPQEISDLTNGWPCWMETQMSHTGIFWSIFVLFTQKTNINEKAQLLYLGFEPRTAGWNAQMDLLNYCSQLTLEREIYPTQYLAQ